MGTVVEAIFEFTTGIVSSVETDWPTVNVGVTDDDDDITPTIRPCFATAGTVGASCVSAGCVVTIDNKD